MSTPVNLNQVIIQTPAVEKIHQPEHQNPEQFQRHQSMVEIPEQTRINTETVPNAEDSKNSNKVENRAKEERKKKREQRQRRAAQQEADTPAASTDDGQGRIVNVIV